MIPWTVAHQVPLSVEFFRQEYWSGLPFPSLGDLPHPGIEPGSPVLQADLLPYEPPGKPEQGVLCFSMCIEYKRDRSSKLCRKSGRLLRSSWGGGGVG